MSSQSRLVFASIMFAVLWGAAMILWTGNDTANVVILTICAAIAGALWYVAMRKFTNWQAGQGK